MNWKRVFLAFVLALLLSACTTTSIPTTTPVPWAVIPESINELPEDACFDPLIIVNRANKIPECPFEDLAPVSETGVAVRPASPPLMIRAEAIEALSDMQESAQEEGIELVVIAAYRTYGDQQEVMKWWQKKTKDQNLANQYTFFPGHSEHHLGLTVDFGLRDRIGRIVFDPDGFQLSETYTWLSENAAGFGFIERYPEGKEYQTGLGWEPWHWRWLPPEVAEQVVTNDLTFDEWINLNR